MRYVITDSSNASECGLLNVKNTLSGLRRRRRAVLSLYSDSSRESLPRLDTWRIKLPLLN